MPKLAWVLLPLALYGAWLGAARVRGRTPSRHALNVQLSVLLMVYLLATAGLGIFWVANQQLPVFDWHYLFGYGTLVLVALHLWFNLQVVWRTLRGGGSRAAARPASTPRSLPALAAVAVLGLAAGYLAGTARAPSPVPASAAVPAAPDEDLAAVAAFHRHSSLSRTGVFGTAPGIDWGDAPPPFKRYPHAPSIPLGPGTTAGTVAVADMGLSAALQAPAPRNGPLQLAELGTLLHLAAGITQRRGGQSLRAAPSSGGLFPSELYVVARRIGGLAPGLYHYDAEHARLALLGALPGNAGMPSAHDADAAIVLTSIFHRTGYKYRERAWRYAVADAGHLLENLRVAAHAAGVGAVLAPRFDEGRLADALAIDGVREAPLAVMELRTAAGSRAGSTPAVFAPVAATAAGLGATSRIQQATSLQLPQARGGGGIVLPAPRPAAMPAGRAIIERRSKRRFTNDAVPLPVLASMLADLRQPAQLSGAITIHLVVNRVKGLAPGVYRYAPGHSLARVRDGEFAAAARSAALAQDVIGDAAVVLVLAADRRTALADGARGYRHAFIEAGLIGERWLLGATARGLGACPVGAFYDDEAAALIGVDGRREWVLHFAALGVVAR
ncbi:SagB/ThcOx family dehydrogenase [Pseudoduganella lutea]|nr:SagB/ThcOx family dehydrogenase [Pseudoduganella lutea]